MTISASDVVKLRTLTGAGMMDCKNALEEAGGDMDKAAELLRKKGVIKAAKRADKVAADGRIAGYVHNDEKQGVLVEVNCETDFVGKSDDFVNFSKEVAEAVLVNNPSDMTALLATKLPNGKTVEEAAHEVTLKSGEKVTVRRFARYETADRVIAYFHGTRIGVLVELKNADAELGIDVAMHIAAANPRYLKREEVPADEINKEKEIYAEQLRAQGKPENIIENILKGKVDKYYGEICLLEQAFIKDEEKTVGALVSGKGASIMRFTRFELGEGIEKVEKNFAQEVAEQLQ